MRFENACESCVRIDDCLISIGRRASQLGWPLVTFVVRKFDPGPDGHLTVAGDDTPTTRFGAHVEGAAFHHNPTPGPADGEWIYGHNWVSLCLLATHSAWGVIALPLRQLTNILPGAANTGIDFATRSTEYGEGLFGYSTGRIWLCPGLSTSVPLEHDQME